MNEMELNEERLVRWMDAFGYDPGDTPVPEGSSNRPSPKLHRRLDRSHLIGHAEGVEMAELIEHVRPRCVVPMHTLYPEAFLRIPEAVGGGRDPRVRTAQSPDPRRQSEGR